MYPSVLNTFNRPTSTDRLNNPSHSALHNTVSSALGQVQAFVGKEGSGSTLGTLVYDVRSPASNGGGHVQTANKGGTGQTAYTKGDILVAQSSSVLTKLAVGSDGQILVANSSVATGLQWGGGGIKIANSASVISVIDTVIESSILNVTIPGSTLGTSGAVRATLYVREFGNGSSVLVRAHYGGGIAASVLLRSVAQVSSINGIIQYTLIGNIASNSQRAILTTNMVKDHPDANAVTSILSINTYNSTTASVISDASQTMGITAKWSSTGSDQRINIDGTIVERIN